MDGHAPILSLMAGRHESSRGQGGGFCRGHVRQRGGQAGDKREPERRTRLCRPKKMFERLNFEPPVVVSI
jgi:hypothetical protein